MAGHATKGKAFSCVDELVSYDDYMQVTLDIPDSLADQFGGDAALVSTEVRQALAVGLYASGKVSMGLAAELSGLSRGKFEAVLASEKVERNYNLADLEVDLNWAVAEENQ